MFQANNIYIHPSLMAKFSKDGFACLISNSFFSLVQPFISFSLVMASSMYWNDS